MSSSHARPTPFILEPSQLATATSDAAVPPTPRTRQMSINRILSLVRNEPDSVRPVRAPTIIYENVEEYVVAIEDNTCDEDYVVAIEDSTGDAELAQTCSVGHGVHLWSCTRATCTRGGIFVAAHGTHKVPQYPALSIRMMSCSFPTRTTT